MDVKGDKFSYNF